MQYSMQFDDSRFGNIEDAVGFINDLLNRYDWKDSERSTIEGGLSFIAKKMNDKYLYLSIIGGFSSGKSTFINALLRENLLESANTGGTTITKTVIRYAPQRDVIVQFKNGEREVFSKDFFGTKDKDVYQPVFRQYIVNLTISPEMAGRIQEVTIEHPAEILKNGMAIIDTPGTNFVKKEHERLTEEAIRDLSDVSVIFVDAKQQLPKNFIDFVTKNLSDVLNHCIFLAARFDDVDEASEWEETLAHIKKKVSSEFKLQNPIVLPYSGKLVLREVDEDYRRKTSSYNGSDCDRQKLIAESYKTEELIFQRLKEQRVNIIAQKLSNVLKDTLQYLHSSIDKRSKECKVRHAIIEKHKNMNFDKSIIDIKDKYIADLDKSLSNVWESTRLQIEKLEKIQWQQLKSRFYRSPDKPAAISFLTNRYKKNMDENAKKMVDLLLKPIKQLESNAKQMADAFLEKFLKNYSELGSLNESSDKIDFCIDINQIGISYIKYTPDFNPDSFLGLFDDLMDAIFFNNYLNQCWRQLETRMMKDYKRIRSFIGERYNEACNEIFNRLKSEIDKCYKLYYDRKISEIKRDQEEQGKLEEYIAKADADIKKIQKWQKAKISLHKAFAINSRQKMQCNTIRNVKTKDNFRPSPVTTIPKANYCLYCYSVLADNATACPTCGRAVLSMQNGVADVNDKRGTNMMHQILGSLAWWKARR